jgi:UDP-3-O-acyl N-acetylglucosamine deacetylase
MLQRTIKKKISISGVGLHTGKEVNITFKPGADNSGIVFIRTDIPRQPRIKADLNNITSTLRGTSLGNINTIEHVLSALYANSITNLEIELDGPEPPALDGSSKVFCDMINKAGITQQRSKMNTISTKEPVSVIENGKSIIALPADRFMISFMINYPTVFIGTQFYKFIFSRKNYYNEIAPARTYGFMEELEGLKKQGLALGADPENAVAVGKDGYLTKLRFKDELVRHKVLDLIGDLSLSGGEIKAHIICNRSGHDMNIKLAKLLKEVDQHY